MKPKLLLATVMLHLSVFLYVIIGAVCLVIAGTADSSFEQAALTALAGSCFLLALGVEVVAYGVHRRRYWGWIAGLCVFGVYVPSLFLPLGILGLWGLLDRSSRQVFGIEVSETP